jgi:hypothetical protein
MPSVVTTQFHLTVPQIGRKADEVALTRIDQIAQQNKVTATGLRSTGFAFPTATPQADVAGRITGSPTAVDSAIRAIQMIPAEAQPKRSTPTPPSPSVGSDYWIG